MKVTTTRELVSTQGRPHYRYIVSDENGATLATTRDRETARDVVRKIKAEHKNEMVVLPTSMAKS